jgi:hypothetical protein
MTKFVSYVPDEAIERDAQALLAEYAHARGVGIEAPIAIDDIIEKHLKIGIEFDDTHRLFGLPRSGIGFDPDILGAIFFEQKRIVVDESLDPDANPAKKGRYRYTAAHEALAPASRAVRKGPGANVAPCYQRSAERDLPNQPSQGADRTAGRPPCLRRADAAQAGLRRLGRGIPRPQAAGASAVRTDRPSLCRDRAVREPHSRRCLH